MPRRFSRRDFLHRSCCTAAAGVAAASFSRLGLINAMAQGTSDYKALVCIFMFGGNDSNNLIVPLNSTDYANYATIRAGLALAQGSLLPVTPPSIGSPFGFHPKLGGESASSIRARGVATSVHGFVPRRGTVFAPPGCVPKSLSLRPAATDADRDARQFADGLGRALGRQDPITIRWKFPRRDFARWQQCIRGGPGGPADLVKRRPDAPALWFQRIERGQCASGSAAESTHL